MGLRLELRLRLTLGLGLVDVWSPEPALGSRYKFLGVFSSSRARKLRDKDSVAIGTVLNEAVADKRLIFLANEVK